MRYSDGDGLSAVGRAARAKVRLHAAQMFEQDVSPETRGDLCAACGPGRVQEVGVSRGQLSGGAAEGYGLAAA
jgi:hypothetical protein